MSSQELYDNFLLQYDVNGSAAAAGFTDDEIYMFLTKGQLTVLDNVVAANYSEDLENLLITTNYTTVDAVAPYDVPNIKKARISALKNIYKVLTGAVKVKRTGLLKTKNDTFTTVKLKSIDIFNIGNLIESDFNKPIFEWVYYFLHQGEIYFVHDSYTSLIFNSSVTYIRLPNEITEFNTSELALKFHDNVVDAAVHLAMQTVNDLRINKK